MICKEKCSFRQTVNGVLTASSSPTKHSTNAIQLSHRSAYLIPKTSRPDLNPATGKQVCYDYQRRERWRFASSCKYDHVCIKPHCFGTHPQWLHQSATAQEPNTKPTLNCRSSSVRYFEYRTSRSCHDHVDWSRLKDTSSRRVWGTLTYSCRALLRI